MKLFHKNISEFRVYLQATSPDHIVNEDIRATRKSKEEEKMVDLLAIPLKRTLYVDFDKQLGDLINKTSYQNASIFKDDLNEITQLRDKILDSDLSEQSLNDHVAYYYALNVLSKKFPPDQINFTWFQTLSTNSMSSSQYSWNWEQLNVLYNIASLYSLMAIDLNSMGETTNLTLQCKYFQMSAMIINHIILNYTSNLTKEQNENLTSSRAAVADNSTLMDLKYLMMAQAMECYWGKAINDGMKDKIISKLSSQVVTFYQNAITYSNKSVLIRTDWIDNFRDKCWNFQAKTLFRMGKDYHSQEKYGLEVACYQTVEQCLQNCQDVSHSFQSTVKECLTDVERDNDFIYHQMVPKTPITLIEPMNMLNIDVPMEETLFKNVSIDFNKLDNLFNKLLPVEVMESASVFKERQTKYIEERIISPLSALSKLLNNVNIDSLGKDTSAIKLAKLHSISPDALTKYQLALADLKQNQSNVQNQLNIIENMLNDEIKTDKDFRNKHGSLRWNLPESHIVNQPYWDKLNMLKKYLEQGIEMDTRTFEAYESIDKDLIVADIKLPKSNDPLLKEMVDIIEKRDVYILQLEKKNWDNSILPKLIDDYRLHGNSSNFEAIYLENVNNTFKDDVQFVEQEKKINKELISKMESRQQEGLQSTEGTPMKRLDARDIYIEDFKYSLKLLEDVKSNILDASKFYQDLIISVNSFSNEVNEFVHFRKLQQQSLNSQLLS